MFSFATAERVSLGSVQNASSRGSNLMSAPISTCSRIASVSNGRNPSTRCIARMAPPWAASVDTSMMELPSTTSVKLARGGASPAADVAANLSCRPRGTGSATPKGVTVTPMYVTLAAFRICSDARRCTCRPPGVTRHTSQRERSGNVNASSSDAQFGPPGSDPSPPRTRSASSCKRACRWRRASASPAPSDADSASDTESGSCTGSGAAEAVVVAPAALGDVFTLVGRVGAAGIFAWLFSPAGKSAVGSGAWLSAMLEAGSDDAGVIAPPPRAFRPPRPLRRLALPLAAFVGSGSLRAAHSSEDRSAFSAGAGGLSAAMCSARAWADLMEALASGCPESADTA
mmetsp:Transcript_3823/g.12101  ORF Transcript_3823/g.12101 Transcript_3823/m.12101 type:complete len:344 (+) Transcript_3823:211-1242(+)